MTATKKVSFVGGEHYAVFTNFKFDWATHYSVDLLYAICGDAVVEEPTHLNVRFDYLRTGRQDQAKRDSHARHPQIEVFGQEARR